MAAIDVVNRVLREFKRYTGDGLPGEPVNAPLPVGDSSSGVNNPKKSELREALMAPLGELDGLIETAEAAATRSENAAADAEAIVGFDAAALAELLAEFEDLQENVVGGASGIGRAINGLIISNHPSVPDSRLVISPGSCRDKDQTFDMVLPVGWTKTTAAWAAGNGVVGMLDTGAIAANKGYWLFLIYNPTTEQYDFLCSLSATAPVMPSGFTKRRRIGGFATGASGVIKQGMWYANGDFRFKDAFVVVNGVAGNLVTLAPMPIPIGVKLKIQGQVFGSSGDNSAFWIIIRDPDLGAIADVGTQWYEAVIYKMAGGNNGATFTSWTDTGGQVFHVAFPRLAGNLIYIYLQGWTDLREEFA